jgi:signal peptidase I
MNIDFALVLVVLTSVTGFVWLVDTLLFRQRRMDRSVQNSIEQAREPVIVEYSRSLFPVLLIVLIFRSFLFEPFKIPSGSMIPTLLVGDFIVVNKFSYGVRLPVLNKKILDTGSPERGDVVVFRYPVDPGVNFIKRLVGLPGDTIVYRDKKLYINGDLVEDTPNGRFESKDVKCSTPAADAILHKEQLGDKNHKTLVHDRSRSRNGQWVVPANHYFMMGDNRDRSNDSRMWGFVPEENLLGRAVGIWLNFDFDKGCADLSRMGSKIE